MFLEIGIVTHGRGGALKNGRSYLIPYQVSVTTLTKLWEYIVFN